MNDGMDGKMDPSGQQRGGGYMRGGRGGKLQNNMPRQGMPYGQGMRAQQQPMMQSGFPPMGGFPGQQPPMQQPMPVQASPAQKQQIGDQIFHVIASRWGDAASRITGILLDSPQIDLNRLVAD